MVTGKRNTLRHYLLDRLQHGGGVGGPDKTKPPFIYGYTWSTGQQEPTRNIISNPSSYTTNVTKPNPLSPEQELLLKQKEDYNKKISEGWFEYKGQLYPPGTSFLSADIRSPKEREIQEQYTDQVLNPTIATQASELLQSSLKYGANPLRAIDDIFRTKISGSNKSVSEEMFQNRLYQANPYVSDSDKRWKRAGDISNDAAWTILNAIPAEKAVWEAGKNAYRTGKTSVKNIVNKTSNVFGLNKKVNINDNIIKQAGFINTKGMFQRYPKGKLSADEIEKIRRSPDYIHEMNKYLERKKRWGDEWKFENFYEKSIKENNRRILNPLIYGGSNWNAFNYFILGAMGGVYPLTASVLGLAMSPPGIRNQVLKKTGIVNPADYSFLSDKDTIIDITNKKLNYAKINETTKGNMILGGEFVERSNNTVRKAKKWKNAINDTYGDKKYKVNNIKLFYGIENNKFKVGKLNEFDENTELVPVRFGDAKIKKAILNGTMMRLIDKDDNIIYQNTPNTGKFILYSPTTKNSSFIYINKGETGIKAVNDFIQKNKDAIYIHLDNGRYEYYGVNKDGLTPENFKDFYEQDLYRKGNPGYNIVINDNNKYKYGGLVDDPLKYFRLQSYPDYITATNKMYNNHIQDRNDYDYESAIRAGMGPDETGHWSSMLPIDENTSMWLKRDNHPTRGMTIMGNELMNWGTYRGEDGRLYSYNRNPYRLNR